MVTPRPSTARPPRLTHAPLGLAALVAACASRPPPPPPPPPPAPIVASAPPPALVAAEEPPPPPAAPACVPAVVPPPRCAGDAAHCTVREHAVVQCEGLWPTSIAARADGTTAVATLRWWQARAASLLTFDAASGTRAAPLPDSMGVVRVAEATDGLRTLAADPAAQRVVYAAVGGPAREPLPTTARILLGASAGGGGRFDVLVAEGGATPVPLHLASRGADGAWSSLLLGDSLWPYAALTHDAAGRPVAAWWALARGGRGADLVVRDGAGARRVVRPNAPGDPGLAATSVGDAVVLAFRAPDLRVVAPDARGRFVELRVPDTAPARLGGCPPPARPNSPDAPPRTCTARATGATAYGLATVAGRAWAVWIEARLEVDLRVETRCHPVDPAGRVRPPPYCEEDATRLDDRSEATLVARPVALGGAPSLGEAVRVPLGRVPDARAAALLDGAGDALHAVIAFEARGMANTMHRVVLALPEGR